ncbi:MAG: NADH-quinone oxidoreductase subunit C [Bacteroidales bacterium]
MNELFIEISSNPFTVSIDMIPVLEYELFCDQAALMLKDESQHCVAYYAVETQGSLKLICCIADDRDHSFRLFSSMLSGCKSTVRSLSKEVPQLHVYEREIHENYGVVFEGHPWLKPVRYPHNRASMASVMDNYPFYRIEGEELHEVGVGPVHAGVIEPGHFRFICNGEKVLHLEIQLGYQHRGVERLLAETGSGIRRCVLCDNIVGDTSVGYALTYARVIESLAGIQPSRAIQIERNIGLELERIAVHIGDTAALCGDVAYQLGQVVCEALRTEIINTTQLWCGNRFGKGLVRPGGTNYKMTSEVTDRILIVLKDVGERFATISDRIYSLQSVLARFEDIGQVTRQQALLTGAVGMAARACGIRRDIRWSHPDQYYQDCSFEPVVLETGDVLARGLLRVKEVSESINIISRLIADRQNQQDELSLPDYNCSLRADSFALSLTEGWRGEICHSAITDGSGNIVHYKVKDPSFHNWMALALAVRNEEISDFPVCNKSFNLSYCGNDL